jgi:DNA-binding PadR family transcriptional regulator
MQPEPATTAAGRAMTSVIYWTVLGLVIKEPGYGREIYLRYEDEFGDLQPVSSEGHVYTALDNLVKRGFVEEIASIGSGRQPKVRYRATAAGELDYADWIVKEMDEECHRQALWVRQFGMLASNREAAEPILRQVRTKYIERARDYGNDQAIDLDQPPSVDELVAERQRLVLGGILSWSRYAKKRFAPDEDDDEPPRT